MPDAAPSRWPIVLLDWDNTLHDSATTHLAALNGVLSAYGLTVSPDAYRRAYTIDYRLLYRRLGLKAELISEASDRWRRLVAAAEPRLLPGAGEAVDLLVKTGRRVGLVTSGSQAIVENQLVRLGLAGRFDAVVYGDGQPHRPDPAPLLQALAILDATAALAAFCSDTPGDMQMARLAGVYPVGLAIFAFGPDALRAAGAQEIAPSLAAWVEALLAGGGGSG
jgi:HAD superfamily hydrolase (TIGR01549 family)